MMVSIYILVRPFVKKIYNSYWWSNPSMMYLIKVICTSVLLSWHWRKAAPLEMERKIAEMFDSFIAPPIDLTCVDWLFSIGYINEECNTFSCNCEWIISTHHIQKQESCCLREFILHKINWFTKILKSIYNDATPVRECRKTTNWKLRHEFYQEVQVSLRQEQPNKIPMMQMNM